MAPVCANRKQPDTSASHVRNYALARAINDAGVTQEFVADTAGISRKALNELVNGRRVPLVTNAIAIASVLGTTVEVLWGDVK